MVHSCRVASPFLLLLGLAMPLWGGEVSDEEAIARRVAAAQVPLDRLAEPLRSRVANLLQQPTVYCRGPAEAFPCRPCVYHWLLDYPHWGYRAWRALGAKNATLQRKEDGSFVGIDSLGNEVRWYTLVCEPGRRIWYAEGSARAAPLTPAMPLKALLLLRYQDVVGEDGRVGVRHRLELIAQYEPTKAAALAAKLGALTPENIGKKTLEQVALFFSGMAWYLSEHPAWARKVLQHAERLPPEDWPQVEMILRELARKDGYP